MEITIFTNNSFVDLQKSRFTAYMLWAKEIRQEILRVNPEMSEFFLLILDALKFVFILVF